MSDNEIHKDLRSPKYKMRVVSDAKKEQAKRQAREAVTSDDVWDELDIEIELDD